MKRGYSGGERVNTARLRHKLGFLENYWAGGGGNRFRKRENQMIRTLNYFSEMKFGFVNKQR